MLKLLAAAVLATFAPAAPAQTAERPPMESCGDFSAVNGLLFADLTARRVTCVNARRVARRVPRKCGLATSSCVVRKFSCFVGQVAPELRLVRCSRPGGGDDDELFKAIRFEFGS